MTKGILYIMSTAVDGLIKIGKTNDFNGRMRYLEQNGYRNVAGLKRQFAIEVDNYGDKEVLIQKILNKSRVGDSELFSMDIDLAKQLLAAFDGTIIYPNQSKTEIFNEAVIAVENKEILNFNRHHFKDIEFSSSLTNKHYRGTKRENGTLAIFEIESGEEIPNNSNPSKKKIIGQALVDLGEEVDDDESLYQRYHRLSKIILNNKIN